MRYFLRFPLVPAMLLVTLAGCVTLRDVPNYKRDGIARIYPVTVDQAWDIARGVFQREGDALDAIEEHRAEGYMLTSTGLNLLTSGAVMGAWVERVDDTSTRVTAVTKRRVQIDLFTSLTETTFHNRFSEAVEALKAGRSGRSPR